MTPLAPASQAAAPQAQYAHTVVGDAAAAVSGDSLRGAFDRMRAAHRASPMPSYEQRMERLTKLRKLTVDHQDAIAKAISEDFCNRSPVETRIAEVFATVGAIGYLKKNLKSWMKPVSRHVALTMKPGRAKVHCQPLGVIGILSPWNYPYNLAISPMAAALAAGNRVMLKPSELTPRTSALLAKLLAETFEPEVVTVVTGGPEVGAAFSALPFDHLLFTGSTRLGRVVMRAAAENLTPVTLELGGKSPTLIHESYPIQKAAESIAKGKWFNAGQTCIAPDYVLVPDHKLGELVTAIEHAVRKLYPTLRDNADYTSVVNERHYARMASLIADAEARGARKVQINPANETLEPAGRKILPTLLIDVNDDMQAMQEEIFGPVLPLVGYRSMDEALTYINDRPRPLALYYFDHDGERIEHVLEQTTSGGATVNDTLLHFVIEGLPFGGVGPSGMGAYHGREGFETFSHKKAVFYQSRINGAALLAPPYGERTAKVLNTLIGK
jgi:coniferyl-aldehyde dehydrogenase